MSSIHYELARLGYGDGIESIVGLADGVVSDTWMITWSDGTRRVAKTGLGVPPDLFAVEASGLRALNSAGPVRAAEVLAVSEQLLLLPAYDRPGEDPEAWERLGRDLAQLHLSHGHDRFGWERDGYLGWLPQSNPWMHDGHRFFAEHRLLRYLYEPLAEQTLEPEDRRAVERLCERLPELVPEMPPVLTHGDLWSANLLAGPGGRLILIDPAVSYTWAEVDLSMLWGAPRPAVSERAFAAYSELSPIAPGWEERARLLYLRETLSCIAHLGGPPKAVADLREVLALFG
jgi:fructosamine-3-kinase